MNKENIRNIAIIAHVDHGKTTLVDAFMKQNHLFRDNQQEMSMEMILDSGDLEREKGITIKAKNIAVNYNGYKINVIDTPGHADFGGEVERTLNMADGCLLLVDAQEGPMPQTKFVLKRALEIGLKPIVVINKIDKKYANPAKVVDKLNDLFLTLATNADQLDFPVYYAIGREGKAFEKLPEGDMSIPNSIPGDIKPLLDAIIKHVPSPTGNESDPLQMQITTLEFDQHIGRLLVGSIKRGSAKVGDSVVILHNQEDDSPKETGKIKNIFVREGMEWIPVEKAGTGEIIAISGIDSKAIGGTLCDTKKPEALPVIKISNPSVQIRFEANTSPFVGKEGKFVTAKLVQQRLEKEVETNISLKITKGEGGAYYVAGRGELQLSILIETMRREGYVFQIRKPEVIFIKEDGVEKEPVEELLIDVADQYQGAVTSALGERKAELLDMTTENGQTKFTYKILTRNLLGLRNILLTATKGNVVMNNFLLGYVPYTVQPDLFRRGVLVSTDTGVTVGYALNMIQERGDLLIGPATQVYEGMIIGINKYETDLEVNPVKAREKSAVRRNQAEITHVALKTIKPVTLDFALLFLGKDELLEVTPQNLRLRKAHLTKTQRDWSKRANLTDFAKQQMGLK